MQCRRIASRTVYAASATGSEGEAARAEDPTLSLPIDLALSGDEITRAIAVELPLGGFARGEYAIELSAGSSDIVERRLLAFRVR